MRQSMTYLWDLLEPVVTGMGYELIEIEFNSNPKNKVLRLYIDKAGGVLIEDCSDVSRQVSAVIDVEDPISGFFNLEVSSPGLDRPLRKIEDFIRFQGERVKLKTSMPQDGQRNFKGRLKAVENDCIVIECEDKEVSLPVTAIEKARLIPDFGE